MELSDYPLEDRFVLFFDFLGSSEAATNWSSERLSEFISLLSGIAIGLQAREEIIGGRNSEGVYEVSIIPEINTFSDNVVISWSDTPEQIAWAGFKDDWLYLILDSALSILSAVAEHALRIGLLVRGGFSFGSIYHTDGVVLGEALVDAYRLESKEAIFPRVVISPRVIEKLHPVRPRHDWGFLWDWDNIWHLNYFLRMVDNAAMELGSSDQLLSWKLAHIERIDAEIASLEMKGAEHPVSKWKWFRHRFDTATAHISGQSSTTVND
jgi:hypothetical protein